MRWILIFCDKYVRCGDRKTELALQYLNGYFARKFNSDKVRLRAIRTNTVKSEKVNGSHRLGWAYCQKVSGSPSKRHSAPKPNLNEETDHLAREEISGQGRIGGFLEPGVCIG